MIYENVQKYADKRGISIYKLEQKAGLANGTIGKWRDANPKLESIERVAKALNVSTSTLLKKE